MNMNNNIRNKFLTGVMAAAGAAAMLSCTDTWNEHYDSTASVDYNGTTMQALEDKASDFAKVVKATGFDRELNSDNVYTIFAPQNGSFSVSDYIDEYGNLKTDSATVVDKFIKNHISRYKISVSETENVVSMLNSKNETLTTDDKIGDSDILASEKNYNCLNGLIHVIDAVLPYRNNIFEQIKTQYEEDRDSCSLYAFLKIWDADSLDEAKSVSRGRDESGNNIWVDSVTIRNNTVLKNIDAKVYEEDSSFIAIIPSVKAWKERYETAKKLLVFNPSENKASTGATDSLQNYYANMFALTDLFYNKNANEHSDDSLKSTQYSTMNWPYHVYYAKEPKTMHPDKFVNDILSKSGTPISCSNGDAYVVDEYPMTEFEQFFHKIEIKGSSLYRYLDETANASGVAEAYATKNVSTSSINYKYGTIIYNNYDTLGFSIDANGDTVYNVKNNSFEKDYSYVDFQPTSSNVNQYISFQIPNTLSGTYDIYLQTCPIWVKDLQTTGSVSFDDYDTRTYRFYTKIWERISDENSKNVGEYPSSADNLIVPGEEKETRFETHPTICEGSAMPIDTTYIGQYTFKNSYYSRSSEGVILQLQTAVTSKLTSTYSREMLINSIVLIPHDENATEVRVRPMSQLGCEQKNTTLFKAEKK